MHYYSIFFFFLFLHSQLHYYCKTSRMYSLRRNLKNLISGETLLGEEQENLPILPFESQRKLSLTWFSKVSPLHWKKRRIKKKFQRLPRVELRRLLTEKTQTDLRMRLSHLPVSKLRIWAENIYVVTLFRKLKSFEECAVILFTLLFTTLCKFVNYVMLGKLNYVSAEFWRSLDLQGSMGQSRYRTREIL